MEINYVAVVLSSVLAMALGAYWYGPLFGKKWMEVVGATNCDEETQKKMQKEAMPLYVIQFLLTLFQVAVFSFLMQFVDPAMGLVPALVIWVSSALTIWVAFVMPTIAGSAMWNNDPRRIAWTRFFIQSGYQLVSFVIMGVVFALLR